MQRVKVVHPMDKLIFGTRCFINDKEVKARSIDFHVGIDEIPVFTFETHGVPDIDMVGDVQFRFTPETVQQAAIVLRNEFSNNFESREALVASIQSALQEETGLENWNHAARVVADRIIGLEK